MPLTGLAITATDYVADNRETFIDVCNRSSSERSPESDDKAGDHEVHRNRYVVSQSG